MNTFPCNYLVCFINFFFVPAVSPYIFFKKTKLKFLWIDFLAIYFFSCIFNLILTHIVIIFFRVFNIKIMNDGVTYTVIALFSALIISLVFCFIEKFNEFKKKLNDL